QKLFGLMNGFLKSLDAFTDRLLRADVRSLAATLIYTFSAHDLTSVFLVLSDTGKNLSRRSGELRRTGYTIGQAAIIIARGLLVQSLNTRQAHVSRRAFLKGALVTA